MEGSSLDSKQGSKPQHLSHLESVDEDSISSLYMEPEHGHSSFTSPRLRRKRTVPTQTYVSMDDVYKELTELRLSARKKAVVSGKRYLFSDDDSTASMTTILSDHTSLSSIASSDVLSTPHYTTSRDISDLMSGLETMQLELFAQQAEILQLRMSLVRTMMDFEAESKQLREYVCASDEKPDPRLAASWSGLLSEETNEDETFHLSCPQLDVSETSLVNSAPALRSPLSFDMHTIAEETSGDSSCDYATPDGRATDPFALASPTSQRSPISPISPNMALPTLSYVEPQGGRLSSMSGRASPLKRVAMDTMEKLPASLVGKSLSLSRDALNSIEPPFQATRAQKKSSQEESDKDLQDLIFGTSEQGGTEI